MTVLGTYPALLQALCSKGQGHALLVLRDLPQLLMGKSNMNTRIVKVGNLEIVHRPVVEMFTLKYFSLSLIFN